MTAGRAFALIAALCLLLSPATAAQQSPEGPQRVVSLNLCTDELLLLLAGRARIAAVSALADDPVYSPAATLAEGLPQNHGTAEEVLRLAPDLALPDRRGLVLQARGYTHGAGSLIGEVLALAGIDNIAAELGYGGWAQIPLETLLRQRPEVIVIESHGAEDRSLAAQVLRHPALDSLDAEIVAVPERLWACGSPFLAESLERIVAALETAAEAER